MTKIQIDKLSEELKEYKRLYYKGEPSISDKEFDKLEDQLREADPTNPYFKIVGAPVEKYGTEVAHTFSMKSLQKANSVEDIVKWLRRSGISELSNKLNIIGMPKFDGNAGTNHFSKGKFFLSATRGDGDIGQEITEIVLQSKDIPKKIPYIGDLEVRGEFYLPKTYVADSNLRNVVSGLLHRKEITEDMKLIKFVAYDVMGSNFKTMEEKFKFLKQYFNNVTPYWIFNSVKEIEEWFNNHNSGNRHDYDLDLDGLVLCFNSIEFQQSLKNDNDHHNDYNIAWKFDNEMAVTAYDHTDLNLSRLGNLIPVANLVPVMVQGRLIKRASMDNMANYAFLNPEKGDEVYIEIANDIIPRIVKVVKKRNSKVSIPTSCPHCGSELEWRSNKQGRLVHLRCENKKCSEQEFQRIIYWVKNCEMDDVSEKTLEKLRKEKVLETIKDLYSLNTIRDFLLNIDGFGESKVDNLLHQIEKTKKMTVAQFIKRLGVPTVGDKAIKKLGIETVEDFLSHNDTSLVIGEKIIEWRQDPANMQLLKDLRSLIVLETGEVTQESDGPRVCATGTAPIARKKLIEILEEKGYRWVDSVGKETDILLTDDINKSSSKMEKAKKLGIKIMTYDEIL